MNGKSVAERMRRYGLARVQQLASLLTGKGNGTSIDRPAGNSPLEQPIFRPGSPPVAAQRLQQLGRQHHVAILLTLTLIDADHHALTIDIAGLQMDALGDTEAGSIAGCENHSMLRTAHTTEKVQHLLW